MPVELGVPIIVFSLPDQEAVTPEGKFVEIPMPVAPVVLSLIAVKAEFANSVVEVALPAVLRLKGVTVGWY